MVSKRRMPRVIKTSWEGGGSASLTIRIAQCTEKLSSWDASRFGGVKKRIQEAEKELSEWQRGRPDALMLHKGSELTNELDELHRREKKYWHGRVRANEIREVDKNTDYFHHKESLRRKRNQIVKLKDKDDELKSSEEDLQKIIAEYFSDLFPSCESTDFDEATAGLSVRVNEEMNHALNVLPTTV